jgi:hypothetical protein
MSDDDLFIERGIQQALEILERQPEVAATQGSFWIEHRQSGSSLFDLEARGPSLVEDDCRLRLEAHCRYFSHTYYSVQRRSVYLQSIANADCFRDHGFLYEWVQSLTTVAMGKVLRFAQPYCLRAANYDADLQARYTQHPVSWRQTDAQAYHRAVAYFKSHSGSLAPFEELIRQEGLDLGACLEGYLASFDNPEENPLEHQRHLIHFLEHLFPGTNPLPAIKQLGQQTREREIGALDAIDKGLETLLQYMHYFGKPAHDRFPTPYSILAGGAVPGTGSQSTAIPSGISRGGGGHAA